MWFRPTGLDGNHPLSFMGPSCVSSVGPSLHLFDSVPSLCGPIDPTNYPPLCRLSICLSHFLLSGPVRCPRLAYISARESASHAKASGSGPSSRQPPWLSPGSRGLFGGLTSLFILHHSHSVSLAYLFATRLRVPPEQGHLIHPSTQVPSACPALGRAQGWGWAQGGAGQCCQPDPAPTDSDDHHSPLWAPFPTPGGCWAPGQGRTNGGSEVGSPSFPPGRSLCCSPPWPQQAGSSAAQQGWVCEGLAPQSCPLKAEELCVGREGGCAHLHGDGRPWAPPGLAPNQWVLRPLLPPCGL